MPRYPSQIRHWTPALVRDLLDAYSEWIRKSKTHTTFSSFAHSVGIKHPYTLLDRLTSTFTEDPNFIVEFDRIEKEREDKLVEIGIFNKNINQNFLIAYMRSKFNWANENTVNVGIDVNLINEAKQRAMSVGLVSDSEPSVARERSEQAKQRAILVSAEQEKDGS